MQQKIRQKNTPILIIPVNLVYLTSQTLIT